MLHEKVKRRSLHYDASTPPKVHACKGIDTPSLAKEKCGFSGESAEICAVVCMIKGLALKK